MLELSDAVEDEKGYIYSRAAIAAHIRQQGHDGACFAPFPGASRALVVRGGGPGGRAVDGLSSAAPSTQPTPHPARAPTPARTGVNHSVVLSKLKPATRVLRTQKRRRLGLDAQRGTQGGAGGSGTGIEVIDV